MGAKPKQTKSPARTTAAKRAPARKVPTRKTASKSLKAGSRSGKTVEAYVAGLEGWQAAAAQRLREVVRTAGPSLAESMKWGQPVYEDNGPVCYFRANTEHLTFGFWRGTELDDPDLALEGDGDRMKHLKIRSTDEVVESLGGFVRQAVELNKRLGDPTRKEPAPALAAVEESEPMAAADREAIPVAVPEPPVTPSGGTIPAAEDTSDNWRDEFQP